MTQLRILELAWNAALDKWARAHDELEKMPDNKVRQVREGRAYKELQEVEDLYREESARVEKTQK